MITTKEQWKEWVHAIVKDLKTCNINEEHQAIADQLAKILGCSSESDLLGLSPFQLDLYQHLLGRVENKDMESQFHEYVNRNSFFDEKDLLAPKRQYYPPCHTIFSLLPEGITLSEGETEWFWTNLVLNNFMDFNGDELLSLDYVQLHKQVTLTTAADNQMLVRGDIDPSIVEKINFACLDRTQGRFSPLITA